MTCFWKKEKEKAGWGGGGGWRREERIKVKVDRSTWGRAYCVVRHYYHSSACRWSLLAYTCGRSVVSAFISARLYYGLEITPFCQPYYLSFSLHFSSSMLLYVHGDLSRSPWNPFPFSQKPFSSPNAPRRVCTHVHVHLNLCCQYKIRYVCKCERVWSLRVRPR